MGCHSSEVQLYLQRMIMHYNVQHLYRQMF